MRISDWSSDVCSSDLGRAGRVCRLVMLAAVQFDDQAGGVRGEVREIGADGNLAAEPGARQLFAEESPEAFLGVGCIAAQFSRAGDRRVWGLTRSEEHKSELQSLMRISSAVFCLKTITKNIHLHNSNALIIRFDHNLTNTY